jgi:DNA-binding SARP family transcriptional activator
MQAAKGGDRVPELRLALLGPPRVERDGDPVEVDTRKAIALLAYVAVAVGWQSRDGIAALLWPDYDRTHARGALRRTLSVLNRALAGGDWLRVERAAVRLDTEHAWFDVRRCSQLLAACAAHGHPVAEVCARCVDPLAEAVALHRGDFLAGFSLRDSDSFDEWQSFQADGLRRELAGALDRLTRGLAGTGRWEEAAAAARRWLALDPLHEPAHQRLMRLYAWSGQRAAALRQYRACVRVLDDELGVAPLEDTTALYQAILENRVDPPAPLSAAGAATGAGAEAGAEAGAAAGVGVEPVQPALEDDVTPGGLEAELGRVGHDRGVGPPVPGPQGLGAPLPLPLLLLLAAVAVADPQAPVQLQEHAQAAPPDRQAVELAQGGVHAGPERLPAAGAGHPPQPVHVQEPVQPRAEPVALQGRGAQERHPVQVQAWQALLLCAIHPSRLRPARHTR